MQVIELKQQGQLLQGSAKMNSYSVSGLKDESIFNWDEDGIEDSEYDM